MTNAEWLRSLSDEQLLDWLVDHACMTERSCNERCHDAKMCRACLKLWMETKANCSDRVDESKNKEIEMPEHTDLFRSLFAIVTFGFIMYLLWFRRKYI